MKQLFANIRESIYSPEYYSALKSKSFSFSFKYYLGLILLLSVGGTVFVSIPLIPSVSNFIRQAPIKFFAYYPDELEIRFENGTASSSVQEPYFLPLPSFLQSDDYMRINNVEHLAVIDTRASLSLEQFRDYKSAFAVGRNEVITLDGNNDIRIISLNSHMNFVLNETTLHQAENIIKPFYKFILPLFILVIFVGLFIALSVKLIYLLIGTLFILLLGGIALDQKWTYGEAYRIGLHAITLPILLSGTLWVTHLESLNFFFLPTLIMLAVVHVNFKDSVAQQSAITSNTTDTPQSPSTSS